MSAASLNSKGWPGIHCVANSNHGNCSCTSRKLIEYQIKLEVSYVNTPIRINNTPKFIAYLL
jgi:hypothetical protein